MWEGHRNVEMWRCQPLATAVLRWNILLKEFSQRNYSSTTYWKAFGLRHDDYGPYAQRNTPAPDVYILTLIDDSMEGRAGEADQLKARGTRRSQEK